MHSLNKQEKDLFYKLSKSHDGKILTEYMEKLIQQLSDVDSLTTDIIKNRQVVKSVLKAQVIDLLRDTEPQREEAESYE